MYIKLYRLVDGAHVIGKQEKHCIKDVLQVTMTPQEDNTTRIGVVPMLFPFQAEHKGQEISLDHVMCSIDCPSPLLNVYMEAISSTTNFQVPTLQQHDYNDVAGIQQGPL